MRPFAWACACLALIGCSTEGDLTIHNDSGPDLEVTVDGSTYLLYDGETVTKRIELGRKFIFGPDNKVVAVHGDGYCKLPFDDRVAVDEDCNVVYTVYGDAGYIDICNETGHTLELYLSSCAEATWGYPLEMVPDGYCTTWMLEQGCWDMLGVTIEGDLEEYNILILPCETESYDLVSSSLKAGPKNGGIKMAPGRPGAEDLRKQPKGLRSIE
jgi:hypothetical protein